MFSIFAQQTKLEFDVEHNTNNNNTAANVMLALRAKRTEITHTTEWLTDKLTFTRK